MLNKLSLITSAHGAVLRPLLHKSPRISYRAKSVTRLRAFKDSKAASVVGY